MKIAGAFSKQAREPIRTSVAIKGNRMASISSMRTSIIDLDKETFTEINPQKKTYSVMTFAEMAEAMQRMAEKMNQPDKSDKAEMDFKVSVKETGETKQIAGLDTKEMIMTFDIEATDKQSGQQGTMTVTTDLWLAAEVPGYDEVRDFHRRMAGKMAWTAGSAMTMGRADIGRGMVSAAKEIAKMDGVPVLQIVKMGGSEAGGGTTRPPQTSTSQSRPKTETPTAGSVLGGALGGRLGGLGGLSRRRKQERPKEEARQGAAAQEPAADTSGVLMEMTTELSNFSSGPVDEAKLQVPAGFKQVESELKKLK
ncbi:MAG: hypothetical protein ABIZ80_24155, partial [Bryobacteraceae bacterium]